MPTSRSLRSHCPAWWDHGTKWLAHAWCVAGLFGSTPRGFERRIRIDPVAVVAADADLEVEMRRGGIAGHAREPDDLTLRDAAAVTDELREVGVEVGVAVVGEEVRGVP